MRGSVSDYPTTDGASGDATFDSSSDRAEAFASCDQPITPAATFVRGYPSVLSDDECKDIIRRFEIGARRHAARLVQRRTPPGGRDGFLDLLHHPEWADVCRSITEITWLCLDDYARRYPSLQSLARPENCLVTPPIIERIKPGQGHGYHVDGEVDGELGGGYRPFLSGLLYLRDGHAGGRTEFPFQLLQVRPRAGMMLLFPSFWTHLHRRASPAAGIQYNITNQVVVRPRQPTA
jgi:hypothetical protein